MDAEKDRPARRGRRAARRIRNVILLNLAKGMSNAIGGAIATGLLWWAGHR